jgi:hypothetical protein
MSMKAQLDRLAAEYQRRMIVATAAEHGLTYAEFMEEAHRFFEQSLADQLAEVDRIHEDLRAAGMSMDDIDDIKETLIRENRP